MQSERIMILGRFPMTCIESVRSFWENNPLWSGESDHPIGSPEFFKEHTTVYYNDCFAGSFDPRFLPVSDQNEQDIRILDLGCGIGFWTTELGLRGYSNLFASDLTEKALEMTTQRLKNNNLHAKTSIQNAERTSFDDDFFDHVNCQGVIHHTPNTERAVKEISRILKPNGTASISVYYRNVFLRNWPAIRFLGWVVSKVGGKLKGRGRENIFRETDADEIVRLFDGINNPIGKCYSKKKLLELLKPYFHIEETYLHFFPARSLPFKIPAFVHRFLDKTFGFMIYATLRNKCAE